MAGLYQTPLGDASWETYLPVGKRDVAYLSYLFETSFGPQTIPAEQKTPILSENRRSFAQDFPPPRTGADGRIGDTGNRRNRETGKRRDGEAANRRIGESERRRAKRRAPSAGGSDYRRKLAAGRRRIKCGRMYEGTKVRTDLSNFGLRIWRTQELMRLNGLWQRARGKRRIGEPEKRSEGLNDSRTQETQRTRTGGIWRPAEQSFGFRISDVEFAGRRSLLAAARRGEGETEQGETVRPGTGYPRRAVGGREKTPGNWHRGAPENAEGGSGQGLDRGIRPTKSVLAHSAAPGYYNVMNSPPQKPLLMTNRYLKDPELRALLTRRSVADSCLIEGMQVEKPAHPAPRKPGSNPSA